MSDPGNAVKEYQATLSRQREEEERRRAGWLEDAKRFRFAWAEGHDTLYKFKGLTGESRDQVLDIIEKSRIYFSAPDQFNDPLDCSPVIKLAKDPRDPDFIGPSKGRMIVSERPVRRNWSPMVHPSPAPLVTLATLGESVSTGHYTSALH